MLSNLSNPKMAAFFTSLFPQFAPEQGGTFLTLMALGAVLALLTAGWLILYAALTSAFRAFLSRGRVHRWLEGLTGAVLVGLCVRVATEART